MQTPSFTIGGTPVPFAAAWVKLKLRPHEPTGYEVVVPRSLWPAVFDPGAEWAESQNLPEFLSSEMEGSLAQSFGGGGGSVSWRHTELAALGPDVVALGNADALAAYRRAIACSSKTRYGLDETLFEQIDKLNVEESGPEVRQWLAERVDGELLLVYGENAVFRVPASFFLDNWQDMFSPSRDDVIILPVEGGWPLLYCHEDEFEFARGGPAELGAGAGGGA